MIINFFRSNRALIFSKIVKQNYGINTIYNRSSKYHQSSTLIGLNQPIANSAIVRQTMDSLISLHDYLGIPWALEISMITIVARAFIAFPLTVLQRKILLRYAELKPEIQLLSRNLRNTIKEEAYLLGLSAKKTQQLYRKTLTKEINRLIQRDNCHPMKATLVAFFQIPMWIILSNCYRNLALLQPDPSNAKCIMAHEQLKNEGLFWFTDLTIPDPIGILPIITCIMNLTIIQIHVNERKKNNLQDSLFVKIITNGGRLFSIALVPLGLMMPSDMSFYWCISSSMGLIQNLIIVNPKMKKLLKIESKQMDK